MTNAVNLIDAPLPVRIMVVPSCPDIAGEWWNALRMQLEGIIPAMQRGHPYTLKELCGPEFWDPLTEIERQIAGKCVAFMVTAGYLPFEFVGCKHAHPKEYRLK